MAKNEFLVLITEYQYDISDICSDILCCMQGKGKGLIKSANGYKYEIDFKNDTMMLRQMLIMVVLLKKNYNENQNGISQH